MRFHVCDSASVSGLCLMALYLAPMDAASNSGRFSSQTFRTSSLISGRSFLDAERKAFVRAIEFDLSPRGDDWICRTFIAQLHAKLCISEIIYFVSCNNKFKSNK